MTEKRKTKGTAGLPEEAVKLQREIAQKNFLMLSNEYALINYICSNNRANSVHFLIQFSYIFSLFMIASLCAKPLKID